MKVREVKGNDERTVLIGMVVSPQVLGRVAVRWNKDGLFASPWANIVGGWCVKFFRKHNQSPGKKIEVMFRSWADHADRDTVKLVEKFLSSISGQHTRAAAEINPDFILDIANELFNRIAAKKLVEGVEGDLEIGKVSDALKRIQTFHKVEIGSDASINLFSETAVMEEALDDNANATLISYPGALGRFFGDALSRESFIAVIGPEKRGKSFVLHDMAWRAATQRRKVAYFEAGDLSRRQLLRRFYTRMLGRPLKATKKDRPVMYPKSISTVKVSDDPDADKKVEISHDVRNYPESATEGDIRKRLKKVQKEVIKSDKEYLKLSVHPNSTLTMAGLRSILHDWSVFESWVPDVVVIDYADILAPPAGFHGESRDAVNDNWKAMRRLSQELHCLVVCGTQANAASYTAQTLGMHNFSEDKRKFSHVTGMFGLNQISDEKKAGVQRWNWLVLREEDFLVSDSVYVAQCLAVANPCVRSAS